MSSKAILSIALAASLSLLIGCGGPSGEGGDVPAAVQDSYAKMGEAAKQAGGNFDSLSDADRKLFLDRVGGDESQARVLVKTMTGQGPAGQAGRGRK